MHTIALVNTKGGTAKSTSAIMLAAQLARNGDRVEVVDADPQQSITRLQEVANAYDIEYPFGIEGHPVPNFHRFISPRAKWAIVDTPPGDEKIIRSAIRWADLVIVPAKASFIDLDRTLLTAELVKRYGKQPHLLLTQVNKHTIVYRETREVLAQHNLHVYDAAIPQRTILTNVGIPNDPCGYDDVAREIKQYFGE